MNLRGNPAPLGIATEGVAAVGGEPDPARVLYGPPPRKTIGVKGPHRTPPPHHPCRSDEPATEMDESSQEVIEDSQPDAMVGRGPSTKPRLFPPRQVGRNEAPGGTPADPDQFKDASAEERNTTFITTETMPDFLPVFSNQAEIAKLNDAMTRAKEENQRRWQQHLFSNHMSTTTTASITTTDDHSQHIYNLVRTQTL